METTPRNIVFGGLLPFHAIAALQKLEMQKAFLRFCALLWREMPTQSALAELRGVV